MIQTLIFSLKLMIFYSIFSQQSKILLFYTIKIIQLLLIIEYYIIWCNVYGDWTSDNRLSLFVQARKNCVRVKNKVKNRRSVVTIRIEKKIRISSTRQSNSIVSLVLLFVGAEQLYNVRFSSSTV